MQAVVTKPGISGTDRYIFQRGVPACTIVVFIWKSACVPAKYYAVQEPFEALQPFWQDMRNKIPYKPLYFVRVYPK